MAKSGPNLRPLRCDAPGCPDRRQLQPDPARPGWLVCAACGRKLAAAQAFKPYASLSGSIAVSTGTVLALGWVREAPAQRWSLLAFGVTQLAWFIYRVVYQARTLKRLRAGQTGAAT